jgi:mono/diheme cytochrome c family protein
MRTILQKLRNDRLLRAAGLGAALLLASCSVEIENLQPAREIANQTHPSGSIYAGWRIYQDKCASCHGPAGLGTAGAPDLLPRVRGMGSRQFVSLVLQRYDWGLPPVLVKGQGPEHEAMVDQIDQRKAYMLTMPAWQGEPSVNAHIADLYAYLSARAQGALGTGRPVD